MTDFKPVDQIVQALRQIDGGGAQAHLLYGMPAGGLNVLDDTAAI